MISPQPARTRIIRRGTLLIAIAAFHFGLVAAGLLPGQPPTWLPAVPAAVWFACLCASVIARSVVTIAFGVVCPSCGRPTMELRSVVEFGDRFYSCSSCGGRRRRTALGPWEDASGPEFDERYAATSGEDPWSQPPDLSDGEVAVSKTHALLVRSKRRRNPDEPNGPGVPS